MPTWPGVEEPLAMDAYDDLAALRQDSPVAISGGELNNQGLPEFGVMLEKACFDIYSTSIKAGCAISKYRLQG